MARSLVEATPTWRPEAIIGPPESPPAGMPLPYRAHTAPLHEAEIATRDRHWKIHWMLNFAQLSATLNLRAVMEKVRGGVDEELLGRLQNSASDRNWDSIEALWKMKEEAKADPALVEALTTTDVLGRVATVQSGTLKEVR